MSVLPGGCGSLRKLITLGSMAFELRLGFRQYLLSFFSGSFSQLTFHVCHHLPHLYHLLILGVILGLDALLLLLFPHNRTKSRAVVLLRGQAVLAEEHNTALRALMRASDTDWFAAGASCA